MAEGGDRMTTRSMAGKEKETSNEEETQPTSQGSEDRQPMPTETTTTNPTDGLDDIDQFLIHSTRKVMKFWYLPDLRNNRLRDILETRLPHASDPVKILVNAPELKRFFPTTTFEICLNTGKVYTFTDPRVDIGVSLEPHPFNLDELEKHFKELTKTMEIKRRTERIPLMERITPTTEVMSLREFERNINQYSNLCRMYGRASCKLFRCSSISEEVITRAYDKLQPHIGDILDQVEKGQSLFRMEREIRNQKGRGRLQIPYIIPKEKTINTTKELQEFIEAVDNNLTNIIISSRNQEEEFENREKARKEEEERLRQEQITQRNRQSPMEFNFHNITSTPLRGESNRAQLSDTVFHTANNNRQMNRGVNFNPNPTHHLYSNTSVNNSSDEYTQFSNDSIIQGTEMNNRISLTNAGIINSDNNEWNQGHTGPYAQHMTGNTGRTCFSNESPPYQQRNPITCFRCGEQGHVCTMCEATGVYCIHCRTPNHNTRAWKKYGNTNNSPPPQTAVIAKDTTRHPLQHQ